MAEGGEKTGTTDDKPDFARGIPVGDLPEGAMIEGTLGEDKVLLLRRDGAVTAIGARCTHLGAPLAKGIVAEGEIRCPWHHARFSLETGEAVGAPAFAPLPCYRAEERANQYLQNQADREGAARAENPGAAGGAKPEAGETLAAVGEVLSGIATIHIT